MIPLLDEKEEDEYLAEKVKFKNKLIKKEEKYEYARKSEREKLKEKLKNVHPNFRKILKSEIKTMNKPTSAINYRK